MAELRKEKLLYILNCNWVELDALLKKTRIKADRYNFANCERLVYKRYRTHRERNFALHRILEAMDAQRKEDSIRSMFPRPRCIRTFINGIKQDKEGLQLVG